MRRGQFSAAVPAAALLLFLVLSAILVLAARRAVNLRQDGAWAWPGPVQEIAPRRGPRWVSLEELEEMLLERREGEEEVESYQDAFYPEEAKIAADGGYGEESEEDGIGEARFP